MSNKGLDLKLGIIENNATSVPTFTPSSPDERRFIGMFSSLDDLKSYSPNYKVGNFAAVAREVKNEGLPTIVEYDEYVYTGSTDGWVLTTPNVGMVIGMVNDEIIEDSNRGQESHNTNPSEWDYDNIFPTNATLNNLKSKFGIRISNGICGEFLIIGKTLDFLRTIRFHKQCKTLSASTIVTEMRRLASFTDEWHMKNPIYAQHIPVNVQNNVNCHIWLLCVSALTTHMWWDEQVAEILRTYEERMIDAVVFQPPNAESPIVRTFMKLTAEVIAKLINRDPKCIGVHFTAAQLTTRSEWNLWWRQEYTSLAAMQGKNLSIYRFKKYLGRYIRSAFRGLWTLLHN